MKILFCFIVLFTLISCEDAEVKRLKAISEDSKCKADFAGWLVDNGTNIMVLGNRLGLRKELEKFNKLQGDSTITCDSLKNAFSLYSDVVSAEMDRLKIE